MLDSKFFKRFVESKAVIAFFLFIASFCSFIPSLQNSFVWDDLAYIKNIAPYHAERSLIKLSDFLPEIEQKKSHHYRPVRGISWRIDSKIWGANPFGFHLSNSIYYAISSVLFYFLALIILKKLELENRKEVALLSALLFIFYPLHVEPVSWIAARADLLCSLFFFLAFLSHVLSFRNIWFLVIAAICFYLSLLSKEVAIVFPILILGFDLISGKFSANFNIRVNLIRYSVYVGFTTLYLYLRSRRFIIFPQSLDMGEAATPESLNQSDGLIFWILNASETFFNTYLLYLRKLIFPFDLNPFISSISTGFYHTALSFIVILLICFAFFIFLKRNQKLLAFLTFWIFATIGPVIFVAIFNIASTPVAERFLYIPSAGFCMLIGFFILETVGRVKSKQFGWIVGGALCLVFLITSVNGQRIWKNNLTLWKYASTKSPEHPSPHISYGLALIQARQESRSITELMKVFEIESDKNTDRKKAQAANLIAVAYGRKKDFRNSINWFKKSIGYDSEFEKPYYNLATYYLVIANTTESVSDYRRAEKYFLKTVDIRPDHSPAHVNLANIYSKLGENEKAKKHSRMARKIGIPNQLKN